MTPLPSLMRPLLTLLTLMGTFIISSAETTSYTSPSSEKAPAPIKLFNEKAPGETELLTEKIDIQKESSGKTDRNITNVSTPTLEIYPGLGKNGKPLTTPHRAITICPGGGYHILSYDKEGTEAARWFQERGITAALLKYRVPRRAGRPMYEAPLQDLQRALRYLRSNHKTLHINPQDIGIIGFSAGAHLCVMANVEAEKITYPAQDNVDKESATPNFTILVYPAYLNGDQPLTLAPEIVLPKAMGPTFILQTADDHAFMPSTLSYYNALHKQNLPVEMHLYPGGSHGFGWRLRHPSLQYWKDNLLLWLKDIKPTSKG